MGEHEDESFFWGGRVWCLFYFFPPKENAHLNESAPVINTVLPCRELFINRHNYSEMMRSDPAHGYKPKFSVFSSSNPKQLNHTVMIMSPLFFFFNPLSPCPSSPLRGRH